MCFNHSINGDECFPPHYAFDYDTDLLVDDHCDINMLSMPSHIPTVTQQPVSDDTQIDCGKMCTDIIPVQPLNHSNVILQTLNPFAIRDERRLQWPKIHGVGHETLLIYNAVRDTGLPNCLSARVPLASALNLPTWQALATGHPYDLWIREMLQFGFPLQYTGPIPSAAHVENHASALKYPEHIRRFIEKEITELAMLGPLEAHPFPDAIHVNPIMTRPKADPAQC